MQIPLQRLSGSRVRKLSRGGLRVFSDIASQTTLSEPNLSFWQAKNRLRSIVMSIMVFKLALLPLVLVVLPVLLATFRISPK